MNKILPLIIVGVLTSLVALTPATTVDSSTDSLDEKVTKAVTMQSATVLLDENFSGPFPPDGWSTDWWTQCNCSGDPCACLYYYNQGDDNSSYITSKAVDASNYEKVILEFWFSGDVQSSCYLYVKYRMNETSPWKDITPWDVPITSDFADWFRIAIICCPGDCGDALQINWTCFGYYFRSFYLDDVKIYSQTNNPPDTPTIDGPTSGKVGVEYNYTFHALDPEYDDVYYYIDWGDGTNTSWIGPYAHCINVTVNHTWSEKRNYIITAKAKDICGAEGPEGTLEVTMPKNKQSSVSTVPVMIVCGLFPRVNDTTITYWSLVWRTILKDEFRGYTGKIILYGFTGGPLS